MDLILIVLEIIPCILLYYLMGAFTCYLFRDDFDGGDLFTLGFIWPFSIWIGLGLYFFIKLPRSLE